MIEWLGTAYTFGKQALGWYKDGKEAVRAAKELYEAGKGIKEHLQHEPAAEPEVAELSPKVVDLEWLVVSGFRDRVQAEGYKLRWSRSNAVPTRELDGYEVLYEVDQKAHTRRSLTRYDGSILIGKKG